MLQKLGLQEHTNQRDLVCQRAAGLPDAALRKGSCLAGGDITNLD